MARVLDRNAAINEAIEEFIEEFKTSTTKVVDWSYVCHIGRWLCNSYSWAEGRQELCYQSDASYGGRKVDEYAEFSDIFRDYHNLSNLLGYAEKDVYWLKWTSATSGATLTATFLDEGKWEVEFDDPQGESRSYRYIFESLPGRQVRVY